MIKQQFIHQLQTAGYINIRVKKHKSKTYSKPLNQFLKQNAPLFSIDQLTKEFNQCFLPSRTEKALYLQCRKLGVKTQRKKKTSKSVMTRYLNGEQFK